MNYQNSLKCHSSNKITIFFVSVSHQIYISRLFTLEFNVIHIDQLCSFPSVNEYRHKKEITNEINSKCNKNQMSISLFYSSKMYDINSFGKKQIKIIKKYIYINKCYFECFYLNTSTNCVSNWFSSHSYSRLYRKRVFVFGKNFSPKNFITILYKYD